MGKLSMLGKTLETWKARAKALKTEIDALMIAYRDPRTPWTARVWALLVVAYALSPIDLIPDFIPVLGYLDDLILLPLGIALAVKLIPPEVMDQARKTAIQAKGSRIGWLGVGLICLVWLSLLGLAIAAFLRQIAACEAPCK
jgi:uncharacterized membrane protein YkvA (DUF1232 family)